MAGEFGGALESVIFSQSHPLMPASSRLDRLWPDKEASSLTSAGYWGGASVREVGGFDVFIAPHHSADAGLWESIGASLLNRQTGRLLSAEVQMDLLKTIEAHYIITEGKEWVKRLLYTQRDLSKLLIEAVQPLKKAFGYKLVQLQGLSDGDDVSLTATVQWQDDANLARAARDNFDQDWWLANCNRAHGFLVFDYELVDAI